MLCQYSLSALVTLLCMMHPFGHLQHPSRFGSLCEIVLVPQLSFDLFTLLLLISYPKISPNLLLYLL